MSEPTTQPLTATSTTAPPHTGSQLFQSDPRPSMQRGLGRLIGRGSATSSSGSAPKGFLIFGTVLVLVLVVVAVFAPLLAPYSPTAASLGSVTPTHIPGSSWSHLLGLDVNGRDELSRLIYGARTSLVTGVASTAMGALIGLVLGLTAAMFGGVGDMLVMRLVDVLMTIPGLVLSIGIAALMGQSSAAIMVAIAVTTIPTFARLLRGSVLAERSRPYVAALDALGIPRWQIAVRHVLPNAVAPLLTQATMTVASAILDAAALAFLGLGSNDPSLAEWGRMLADAQQSLVIAPQLAFLPCLAIIIAASGFTFLGEGLHRRMLQAG
jgi:peptide/nickel transport system permease protein